MNRHRRELPMARWMAAVLATTPPASPRRYPTNRQMALTAPAVAIRRVWRRKKLMRLEPQKMAMSRLRHHRIQTAVRAVPVPVLVGSDHSSRNCCNDRSEEPYGIADTPWLGPPHLRHTPVYFGAGDVAPVSVVSGGDCSNGLPHDGQKREPEGTPREPQPRQANAPICMAPQPIGA